MIVRFRFFRDKIHRLKRKQEILTTLVGLILCLIIMNFFSSDSIYNNSLNNLQNDENHIILVPKVSGVPNITVNIPANYSLHGKAAPDYSIHITGGPGNYTWYEFLETSNNSTPIELSGLLDEEVNGTFDQDLWDNLDNGTVTIRFYANDSLNAIGYTDAIIRLDIIAPEKPNNLIAIPSSWTNVNSFNLSWSNPLEPSGIIGAYYKLDEAPTSDTNGTYVPGVNIDFISNITISTDGNHTLYLWLVDNLGNINYTKYASTQLYLDTSDPLAPSSLTATPSSWTNVNSFNLSWSNPLEPSGIIGAYYKLDEAPTSDTNGTYVSGVNIDFLSNITVTTDGNHTLFLWLVDAAGNLNYTHYATTQLCLDASAPLAPSSLLSNPSSWTNLDSFNITWVNPSDMSGVVGAYYKLNEAPTSDYDGTYVPETNIESIFNITVSTDGNHTLYLWLVDAAGNLNYTHYITTQLYLDTSAPLAPSSLTATPSSWTNVDSFNITWVNPSDMSGIVGAYYKLDIIPLSDNDGIYVPGTNIESIFNITVSTDGNHTLYLWLVDAVGNLNYTHYITTQLYLDTSAPPAPSSLIANPSSWVNIDSYNITWINPSDMSGVVGAYYKLNEAPTSDYDGTYVPGTNIESIFNITVSTDGNHTLYLWLVDAVGNLNFTHYITSQLYLDTSAPPAPSSLIANPSSWVNIDSFNITWVNPSDMSGIVGAYYKLNEAPTSDYDGTYVPGINIESIFNITVSTDENHTLYLWLVDAVGNLNFTHYITSQLYLDTSAPLAPSSLTATPSSWVNIDSYNITWINPSDMSGVVGAYYKLDIIPLSDYDGTYVPGTNIESIFNITVSTDGNHTLYLWLVDAAGNLNYTHYITTQLYLDTSAPLAPSSLTATPSSWTNVDSFNITWENPSDMSGIVGAYYKLDIIPLSDYDGTYVPGTNIESIFNITVSTDGNHTLYLWLVDKMGNVNYTHYAIMQLYLDTLAPLAPFSLTATPDSWTNVDSFNITWVNPSDMSGIVGAYYKLDIIPLFDYDGIYVPGTNIESIFNITVSTDGNHTLYLWLVDAAGNLNYTHYITTQLYLDTLDPLAPSSLTATPNSWTNVDSFNITWVNPSDMSGLVGFYYIVDNKPITNDNGTYIEEENIELLSNLSVITDGNHTLYVWLVDAAGNVNYNNFGTVQLYLDATQPIIIDNQDGDDTWHDSGGTKYNIDFSDNLPSSTLDFAQYRITSETEQGGIVLKDWTTIFFDLGTTDYVDDWTIDFTACQEGINYISVQVYDKAGNVAILNDAFYVKKDTLNPIVTINDPLNNSYWKLPPPINVSVFEPNLASLTYSVIGYFPINNWLENNTEELLNEYIWRDLPQGKFQLVITCFDILGHSSEIILSLYKDTIAPTLMINAPMNATFYNSPPFFNVSAFDPNLDTIWYSINNINITLLNNTLQRMNLSIWNGLPEEGEFQVHFYANDTFGYLNNITLTLYRDIITPNLIINTPFNNTYWKVAPTINVIVMDSYLQTIWYRVLGTNVILLNNTDQQLNSSLWVSLPEEGEFSIYFYANDTSGNINNISILRLHKDIRNPSITINNPKPNDLFGDIAPSFDISISETYLNQTWYSLVGGTFNCSFIGFTGQINQSLWNEFSNGTVTIRFYANDTVGNLGIVEVTVRKNIYAPIITIVSPGENELFGVDAPNFTIYKSGLALNTTWYTIDNGFTNFTFYGLSGTIDQDAWELYGFANITITFYINDSLGKIGYDIVTIKKDPDPPIVSITFINPGSNNSYCSIEPIFRVSVYEPNLLKIWYKVGTITVEIPNNSDITLNSSIWDTLSQGKFVIEIFAEDLLGYINDPANLTYYKDTLAPKLIINDPYHQTYYDSPPPINITVFDPNFLSLTYTVIGYLPGNIWLVNNTEEFLDEDIWKALPDGEFFISFSAYDSFGHHNNTYILTLYKDTAAPTLLINAPINNGYWNVPPLLNVIAFDPNLDTIWYNYNMTSIELYNNTDQLFNSSLWASIPDGLFYVDFYANDTFGKISTLVRINLTKDITLPLIAISSPINNTYYSNPPTMNIIATDINLDTLWYTVMGTKITVTIGPELLDVNIWNNLSQGKFQVLIFANDSAGNLNDFYILTLFKDTYAPLLFVNSPQNNTLWNSEPILNILAYDPNLDSITYSALGYSPIPLLNNTDELFDNFIWDELEDGMFIVEIFAEDIFGHIHSINLTLYKDTHSPQISINFPNPNGLFGDIAPDFDISVIDSHLDTTWYTLIGENVNITFTGSSGSIDQTTWNKFSNGTVTIRFYANDTVGNLNHKDITVRKDIYAPVITVSSPDNDDIFGSNAPNFMIYKSGPGIQATWYTLDNGLTNFTFTGLSGKINQTAWDNYDFETITIRFYVNNSLGKIGSDEVIVRKDPDAPIIIVNFPSNQTAFALAPLINLTIIEPNLDSVWYMVDNNIRDLTNNLTQYLDSSIWDDLPQGTFILNLYANDTIGNLNNLLQLHLSKDTIGPNITIILPNENQKVDRNAPLFELTLFDENGISHCWYTIDNGSTSIEFTGSIGRINQDLWESIWDNKTHGSIITIRFYSSDNLGNIDFQEVTVIKYQLPPFKILTNPLGFILSTMSLGVMIPVSIKLTKSRYYENLNSKEKSKLKKALIAGFLLLSVMVLFYIF
jgi:hypothetical protein